jgi:hypothetical protein
MKIIKHIMDFVKQILNNPYVIACLIGTGVYYALDTFKPSCIRQYKYATPLNLGMTAALFYIGYLYFLGKISLPFLGRRYPSYLSLLQARTRPRVMTSSISDLLGPDDF